MDRGFGIGSQVKGFAGDTVDIVLRPTEAGKGMTDTFEVWDGEIEFKDVKVERLTKR